VEAICRRLIEVRMQLVPYLYSAFVRYNETGVPPFRAMVIDYPDDPKTWALDNQYLMGKVCWLRRSSRASTSGACICREGNDLTSGRERHGQVASQLRRRYRSTEFLYSLKAERCYR